MNSPISTSSAASEASALQPSGQDSEQWDLLRSNRLPPQFFENIGQPSRTWETSEQSMENYGGGLPFSLEASPASRSVKPGTSEAKTMTATSGRQCSTLFQGHDRLGLLVKTCLGSSMWESTVFLLTWRASATPFRRLLFQLVPLGWRKLKASGVGLWPRPMASDSIRCKKRVEWLVRHSQKQRSSKRGGASGVFEATAEEFGQHPSPLLIEWIMGYPANWTALDASEMPSPPKPFSRSSTPSHASKGAK